MSKNALTVALNVEENKDAAKLDNRHNRPRIKNADSIRQVPISEDTANLIQSYAENYRGKPNHLFLLNSLWNTPLSTESLTKYFNKLSAALPPLVLKALRDRNGSAQPTRTTCATHAPWSC